MSAVNEADITLVVHLKPREFALISRGLSGILHTSELEEAHTLSVRLLEQRANFFKDQYERATATLKNARDITPTVKLAAVTYPYAVVDHETTPPKVLGRFKSEAEASRWIGEQPDKAKVERGGFSIDGPENEKES